MHRHLVALGLVLVFLVGSAAAQVGLRQGAVVYFGSASNTSSPASLDDAKVRDATPEWRTIQAEGVKRGSARYQLLMAEMDKRIREAVRAAAGRAGRDMVVRKGDVDDARGKDVQDLTDAVIANLDG